MLAEVVSLRQQEGQEEKIVNPRPEWEDFGNRRCLLLRFEGHFSAEDALDAIGTVSSFLAGAHGRVTMVWDCTGMTSYDTEAREDWQHLIRGAKPKIERVHLISKSPSVRSWALVVGAHAGIRVDTWPGLEEFRARSAGP